VCYLEFARLKLAARSCIYPDDWHGPGGAIPPQIEGVSLGKGLPFIHVA
jgi:hypothetical protein